jgi:uncharacterized delta-60 repeat protein
MRRLAVVVGLALVGCGGDDDGGAGDPDGGGDPDVPAIALSSSADRVRVLAGDSAVLPIEVERSGGFDGDVTVEVTGLPAGVAADPETIPGGAGNSSLTVEAVGSADQGGPTMVTIRAVASDDDSIEDTLELPVYVAGDPGQVDPSFGTAGTVEHDLGDSTLIQAIDLDPDGRLVVVGQEEISDTGYVVRFTVEGELDDAFADGGEIIGLGGTISRANGVVARSNGIEVLIESVDGDDPVIHYVRRYDDAGEVDSGYGTGGDSLLAAGVSVLAPRGEGVIAGYGTNAFALDEAGEPDADFDPDLPLPAFATLAADDEGRVLLGTVVGSGDHFELRRLLADGSEDDGFGAGGVFTLAAPKGADYDAYANELFVLPDGGFYAALTAFEVGSSDSVPYVAKLTAGGDLDDSFGDGGVVQTETLGVAVRVAVDSEDRVVVLGSQLSPGPEYDMRLYRFLPSGDPDPDFGVDGVVDLDEDLPSASRMVYEPGAERVVVCNQVPLVCQRFWL